ADDCNLLPAARGRQLRSHPSFGVGAVDDRNFDVLDRHRVVIDSEYAGPLTRRRTEPAGELGKIVRGVETIDGRTPLVVIDEIVPIRNQVAERTSLVAERDAAVHASRALLHQ